MTPSLSLVATRPGRAASALVGLCVLALLPTLFSPFFADDYFHIEHSARLGEALTHGWVLRIDSIGAWWTRPGLSVDYFRPLVVLSFALDHFVYGEHAVGYHLTNLLLHVATTLLVWRIARHVLGDGFAAWAAAALFAIHPAHTVAVGWISGRTDVLAAALYAAAFTLYLESRERRPRSTPMLALSCAAFGLALMAKEMAITLPALVLFHNVWARDDEPLSRCLVAPIAAGLVAAGYLALRATFLGGLHTPPTPFAYHPGDPGLAVHALTAPFLYLADLVLFVPVDPVATLPFWQAHPLLLVAFLAVILTTFSGTLKNASTRRVAIWGLSWLAITLLPVLMLTVGEHFLYLPSMGYCVLVASQLPRSYGSLDGTRRRTLAVVGGLVTAIAFGRAAMFCAFSRSAVDAVNDAVAAIDLAPRATHVLIADLPASAALAFPNAVRLARPTRDVDVEILSVVPRVMPDAEDLSVVTFDGPDHFTMRRSSGYLHSYLERALEGPPVDFHAGQTVTRDGYDVTIVNADGSTGRPSALGVRLFDPARTIVLGRVDGHLQRLGAH